MWLEKSLFYARSLCSWERARCLRRIEANTMALAFEKKKLYCRVDWWSHVARWQEAELESVSLIHGSEGHLRGWGQQAGMWKHRWDKLQLEGSGTSPFMVRDGPGLWHLIFLDNAPFALKGFWCSSSCQVLGLWFWGRQGETLVLGVIGGQNSSACVSVAWLVVSFCCPWKTTQYLVRNRIRPVWAGSAVTSVRLSFAKIKSSYKPK